MSWWIWCLLGYGLGSIPFGVIAARMRGIDIQSVGSGNIGATNVLRVLGPVWGVSVFLLDMLKGAVPAILASQAVHEKVGPIDIQMLWLLAGLCAVLGHCFSPFLKFKGGKGIATAFGMVIGAAPWVAFPAFSLFLVVLFATRYMSIASIVGVSSSVILGAVLPNESRQILIVYVPLTIFIVARHGENLKRVRAGTERKFEFRKTESVEPARPSANAENHAAEPNVSKP
ncbi:MAG: glycerol-3-phosphate 1-O-acyltransferase PlsY [Fimbriimonas sp.]